MRIIFESPPMFDEIDARFHVAGKPVIFAWGDIIYNPEGITIPPQLIVHEAVHGARQGGDIDGWWRRYIEDAAFRLYEEIPAHSAEYQYLLQNAVNRKQRRRCLKVTANRLASPLYGGIVSRAKAISLLKEAA